MKTNPATKLGITLVGVLALTGTSAPATLVDYGGGLIYDTDRNLTWLQQPNNTPMNWYQAISWAEGLSYHDPVRDVTWTGWRLPTALEPNGADPNLNVGQFGSEMGHLFASELGNVGWPQYNDPNYGLQNKGPFLTLMGTAYWTGTGSYPSPEHACYWDFGNGTPNANYKSATSFRALAVHDGNLATSAPEPSSALLLLGSAMMLAGWRRRGAAC